MPSWNVHIAHAQRLLSECPASSLGIRDANAFLFGNLVPDVYVGYMLPHPSGILPYSLTHFADPCSIPVPREREFWDLYVEPALELPSDVPLGPASITVEEGVEISRAGGHFAIPATPERHEAVAAMLRAAGYRASDVVLGAWAHLMCDHAYNEATHAWLQEYHVPAGERTRIRKQGDFDKFGRTLPIELTGEATEALVAQAAAFPQYALRRADVERSVEVANAIVTNNRANHIDGVPDYSLFTADFFHEVFEHANECLVRRLTSYGKRLSDRS